MKPWGLGGYGLWLLGRITAQWEAGCYKLGGYSKLQVDAYKMSAACSYQESKNGKWCLTDMCPLSFWAERMERDGESQGSKEVPWFGSFCLLIKTKRIVILLLYFCLFLLILICIHITPFVQCRWFQAQTSSVPKWFPNTLCPYFTWGSRNP